VSGFEQGSILVMLVVSEPSAIEHFRGLIFLAAQQTAMLSRRGVNMPISTRRFVDARPALP